MRFTRACSIALLLTACIDGGECGDFCDTYLDIQVDGIPPSAAPIELRVCDGATCVTFLLIHGECEYQEPTMDSGFSACFIDGAVNVRRLFTLRDDFVINETVTVRIASSAGDELVNEMGTPSLVDAMSCVEECTAREIRF